MTQVAIGCTVGWSILALLTIWFYAAKHHLVPVQGTRIQRMRNYSAGCRSAYPLLFSLIGVVLKLAALCVDTW